MIKLESIKKAYVDNVLFERVSFVVNEGDKIGLIGENGAGKSTLLKIIAGEIMPDEGRVIIDKSERIGYLKQIIDDNPVDSLNEFLGNELSDLEWKARKNLSQFGLNNIDFDRKMSSFSGGELTKIGLAKILVNNPSMILLDEPTNHLDIEGINFLQNFLADFKGGLLLVSHDRWMLDKIATKIIDLKPTEDGRISKIYSGNFSDYIRLRQAELSNQEEIYNLQQKKVEKIIRQIKKVKDKSSTLESKTSGADFYVRRKAAKAAKQVKDKEKKLEKFLEGSEKVGKPQKEKTFKLIFEDYLATGQRVIQIKGMVIETRGVRLLDLSDFAIYGKDRVALLGPNGTGKTSFIKSILGQIKPRQGQIVLNESVKVGYLPQEVSFEDNEKTVWEEFEKDYHSNGSDARKILGRFLFSGPDQEKKVRELSLGQRRRLCLAKIVAAGSNFLILDEPTNHLDIASIEAIEKSLNHFEGAILVISHDRYFLKNIGIQKFYYLKDADMRELRSIDELY